MDKNEILDGFRVRRGSRRPAENRSESRSLKFLMTESRKIGIPPKSHARNSSAGSPLSPALGITNRGTSRVCGQLKIRPHHHPHSLPFLSGSRLQVIDPCSKMAGPNVAAM